MADQQLYKSSHTGAQVDEATTTVLNNNCLVKWGNIGAGSNIENQTDMVNYFIKKSGDTATGNIRILTGDSPSIIVQDSSLVKEGVPSSNKVSYLKFRDKNDKVVAYVSAEYLTSGENSLSLTCFNKDSDSDGVVLKIGYNSNGIPFTQAPTPDVGDNSTKIATTAWVKNEIGFSSGIVHISGTETITGNKTFSGTASFTNSVNFTGNTTAITQVATDSSTKVATTAYVKNGFVELAGDTMSGDLIISKDSSPSFILKNNAITKSATPSSDQASYLRFRDTSGNNLGYLSSQYLSTGENITTIACYPKTGAGSEYLGVGYDSNGDVYTHAPNPVSGDSSNNIATTSWVRNNTSTNIMTILQTMYPIGAIFIGTTATCPMASLFGTWTLVAADRVLQGSSSNHAANTTIAAGLPNITGYIGGTMRMYHGYASGAFEASGANKTDYQGDDETWGSTYFNASRSSTIYGNSETVQPPAYVVNVWRRTA